jgi:hypothetical protein
MLAPPERSAAVADMPCPHCGDSHAAGVGFCPKTGAAMPAPADVGAPTAPPGPPPKGVADILAEAWRLYRAHARVLLLTCAVVCVPAAFVKSCALSAILAPGGSAAAAVAAARAVPDADLDAANRALQDGYQRHADPATLARLRAEQERAKENVARHHQLAAGEAMGSFILFVLGILGSFVTFFAYALAVPFAVGALTIAVADLLGGGKGEWRQAWPVLFTHLGALLTAILPAALVTAFAFACFSALGLVALLLFAFAAPVVLFEGRRGGDALRRSVDLATSDWLRVALMIVALFFLGWVATVVAGILTPFGSPFLSSFVGDLVLMVFLPLPVLGLVLLYFDIRRRRGDLTDERLRASLEALKAA